MLRIRNESAAYYDIYGSIWKIHKIDGKRKLTVKIVKFGKQDKYPAFLWW